MNLAGNTGGVVFSDNQVGASLTCRNNDPDPMGIPGSNPVGGRILGGECDPLSSLLRE